MSPDPYPEIKLAAKVAAGLSATSPLEDSYLAEELSASVSSITDEVDPLVIEETGFQVTTPSKAEVLSRTQWAASNVDSMVVLMEPMLQNAERRLNRTPVSGLMRFAYRPMIGAQLGGVLGFLSRRVLGQYDLIGATDDVVWVVGANLIGMERKLGLVPEDFRKWVLIHELTHRAQFTGNPWMRDHFLDSVSEMLGAINIDARNFVRELRGAATERDEPFALRVLNDDQKLRFKNIQAFMSLLEGHANYVMATIGERVIPTKDRITQTFKPGGSSLPLGPLTKFIDRLLGMEMKRKQYTEGQRFLEVLAAKAGPEAVSECFRSKESLPSLDEIRDPDSWLSRHAA